MITAEAGTVRESLLLNRNMINKARKTKGHVDIDKNAVTACGLAEGGGEVELVIVGAWQTHFYGLSKSHETASFKCLKLKGAALGAVVHSASSKPLL